MKEYKVMASNMDATYNAGKWIADSPVEAIQMAREYYAKSSLGRELHDVGAFSFYTVDKFDYEE